MSALTRHKLLLVLTLACGTGIILSLVPWEARLSAHMPSGDEYNWTVDLGRSPIWAPPPAPRDLFKERFKDVPESRGRITRAIEWSSFCMEAEVGLWLIAVGFTPFYLGVRGDRRDPAFQVCTRIAWAVPMWLLACLPLWVFAGGWATPGCCPSFLGAGVLHGLIAGLLSCEGPAPPPSTGSVVPE
jgi:hypothetical protein